jgi:hypothetical protein
MSLNQSDFCASTAEWAVMVSKSEICSSKSETASSLGGSISLVATLEEDGMDILFVEGSCGLRCLRG